jgi:hypothetical protein
MERSHDRARRAAWAAYDETKDVFGELSADDRLRVMLGILQATALESVAKSLGGIAEEIAGLRDEIAALRSAKS